MARKKFRLGQSREADDLDGGEYYQRERKVDSKRRQVRAERLATEVEAHDPDAMLRLPDPSQWEHLPLATIRQRHSQWVDLLQGDGSEIRATLAGKLKGVKLVCGDRVYFSNSPIETVEDRLPKAQVVAVLPRRSLLKRGGIDDREPWQLVCANADELWVCAAVTDPPLRPGLLERAYALALDASLDFRIIVTKRDKASPKDTLPELDPLREMGLPIIETSAKNGNGLDEIKALLQGHAVVLIGHSGVGKSTLINAMLPGRSLKTGDISKYGTGRQTTTSACWLQTPYGGVLIDTPGIRTLSVRGLGRELLRQVFPEFPPEWIEDPMAFDPEDEALDIPYPERLLSLQRLWEEMAARNPNQNVYR
ncbi:MAG: ribosome small subunit-dependent GTPase A [Holophagales bacterium]|jgi:ribosome biogenesis GTPase|nr:ribosome small subunit-dependent GTPase A [Holophagales bacterium]